MKEFFFENIPNEIILTSWFWYTWKQLGDIQNMRQQQALFSISPKQAHY